MKKLWYNTNATKTIFSLFLVLLIITSNAFVNVLASEVSISDMRASIETKYGVKVDIDPIIGFPDDKKISHLKAVEEWLSYVPQELHNALVAHFKAKGKTITIKFAAPQEVGHADAIYTHNNATILMYTRNGIMPFGFMSTTTFLHEYGHMLHFVLKDLYGAAKFANEWTPLNDGQEYGVDDWMHYSSVLGDVFVRGYSTGSLDEDVADIFMTFSSHPTSLRPQDEGLKDTNIWKKGKLLEEISKSALNINSIYHTAYIPQKPIEIAEEAVKRAFSEEERILGRPDSKPYIFQENIPRLQFFDYLVCMMGRVTNKRYDKWIYSFSYSVNSNVTKGHIIDPKTGKMALDLILQPFRDCGADSVIIASYFGIITDPLSGYFNPDGVMTREEAAAFFERTGTALGIADAGGIAPVPTDTASIANWAKTGVDFVLRNNIMTLGEDGVFSPQQTMTVEQAIISMVRLYDNAVAQPETSSSNEFRIAIDMNNGTPVGKLTRDPETLSYRGDDGERKSGIALTSDEWKYSFKVIDSLTDEQKSRLIWSSSNPAVAILVPSGYDSAIVRLKTLSAGTTVITATDGTHSDSITITIGK